MTGITFNGAALAAQQSASTHKSNADKAIGQISTGKSQVNLSDDAAGRAIALKISADISGMVQARKNASQASSMINVAGGGLQKVADALVRMQALAAQVQNGALNSDAISFANAEFLSLRSEIGEIADKTRYNSKQVLNTTSATLGADAIALGITGVQTTGATDSGSYEITFDEGTNVITITKGSDVYNETVATQAAAQSVSFDNGVTFVLPAAFDYGTDIATGGTNTIDTSTSSANFNFQTGEKSTDLLTVAMPDMKLASLGISTATVSSATNAAAATDLIQTAITVVSTAQSNLGAAQKRLEFTQDRLGIAIENLKGAKASFDEADIPGAVTEHALADVGSKASYAMLAKANAATMDLLKLLQ